MQVAEIMDRDAVTVAPGTPVQDVLALMKDNELPGLPVVNEAGRCVGIVTESDLVLSEEEGDLHMPHHLDIMGGTILLESWKHFEERLEKAMAADVDEMMTADPVTVCARDVRQGRRPDHRRAGSQPPAGRRARPLRRPRHAPRRARGHDARVT